LIKNFKNSTEFEIEAPARQNRGEFTVEIIWAESGNFTDIKSLQDFSLAQVERKAIRGGRNFSQLRFPSS
jgi:hypothetical protein